MLTPLERPAHYFKLLVQFQKTRKKCIKICKIFECVLVSRHEHFDQIALLEVVDYDVNNIPQNFCDDRSPESRATKI